MQPFYSCRWCGARCLSEVAVQMHVGQVCKQAPEDAKCAAVLDEWDRLTAAVQGEKV